MKWAYDIAGIVCTQAGINYTCAPFVVLNFRDSLAVWGSVGFYGIWAVALPMAALNLGGAKWLSRQLKIRDAKYAKKGSAEERQMEEERIKWEKREEDKRVRRGEGVASLGMDVEELAGVESKSAVGGKKVPEKEL